MQLRGYLISVVSSAPLALAAQAPASLTCEHLQLRFVDATRSTAKLYRNSFDGVWYALNDTIVLDERAIAAIGVDSFRLGEHTAWSVFGRTTFAGVQALSEATANHVGRLLGILIGDDLVATPLIENKLAGTAVYLGQFASRAVADSIATRTRHAIDAGCLARTPPGSVSRDGIRIETNPAPTSDHAYFDFQVDTRVSIDSLTPPPHYPDSLRSANVSGEVFIEFVVDTAGVAEMNTFRVIRSTNALFTDAVRSVLPGYRFRPAELGGRKVKQVVTMPFLFSAPRGDAEPVGDQRVANASIASPST